jgi:hypothetical protein
MEPSLELSRKDRHPDNPILFAINELILKVEETILRQHLEFVDDPAEIATASAYKRGLEDAKAIYLDLRSREERIRLHHCENCACEDCE